MKHLFSTLLLLFVFMSISYAQPDTNLKLVKLTNGKEYSGTILSDDGREILMETTTLGKIYIKKSDVRTISDFKKEEYVILNDEVVRSNAFGTRYAFTTNALPIKKKENYYMINLWGPEFHLAVADNFNVGVMTTWIGSPLALAVKYSFQTKNPKLNFSIGELAGSGGYIDAKSAFSLSFANVTFGDRDKNLTLGLGYGIFDFNQRENLPGTYLYYQDIPSRAKPATKGVIGSIGANVRINSRVSFVFDSMLGMLSTGGTNTNSYWNPSGQFGYYVVTTKSAKTPFLAVMPALRIHKGDKKAVQFCLAGINTNGLTIPIPMVSWYHVL
jgi:hypothetical protein